MVVVAEGTRSGKTKNRQMIIKEMNLVAVEILGIGMRGKYSYFPQIVSKFLVIFSEKLTICGNLSIFYQIVILVNKSSFLYYLRITVISWLLNTLFLT